VEGFFGTGLGGMMMEAKKRQLQVKNVQQPVTLTSLFVVDMKFGKWQSLARAIVCGAVRLRMFESTERKEGRGGRQSFYTGKD
jgi:hypothetical protein